VFFDNPFDSVCAFELWLRIGNRQIAEFQADTVTIYDTSWYRCNSWNGSVCEEWLEQVWHTEYWKCNTWDGPDCTDSSLLPPESAFAADWQFVADSMFEDIHDESVGNWDSTSTLISGWDFVESRSVFKGVEEMKVTAAADDLMVPGKPPGIAPQQSGVLFRILADVHNISDTLTGDERRTAIIPDPFLEHFSFSDCDGEALGLSDSLRPDSNFYRCDEWVPPEYTTCANWTKVNGPPYDTVVVEMDTVTYVDPDSAWLVTGSITVLYGLCGQIDGDTENEIDIGDLTYLIAYLYLDGPDPEPLSAANMDCDAENEIDIGDLTWLIAYLYLGGPDPCACQ
jgi:hypothetical protein